MQEQYCGKIGKNSQSSDWEVRDQNILRLISQFLIWASGKLE